jgi:tRNA dimethylallyltransferase
MERTVIILLGPTGVGKTGASILLAEALHTEIISADSMQIYRGMDIGTAKPSPDELSKVPHHLIDILPPSGSFSAGIFRKAATGIIDELHCRGKIPLIVGGTGLYIRSLTRGLFEGPEADWEIRERLTQDEKATGEGHLYARLMKADPLAAVKIDPRDSRRIIRALEVLQKGEGTISELQRLSTKAGEYAFVRVGLIREREELYRLIEERVDRMLQRGLVSETERLLAMKPGRTPLQALGYKEMGLFLEGKTSYGEAVMLLKRRSKKYAKRQLTWFRKEPGISWVNITGIMDSRQVFEKILDDVAIIREIIYP